MRAVPPFPAFSSLSHIFLILKAIAKKAKSIVTLSSPLCLNRLNQYKRQAREILLSEEGIKHRGRRCIEPVSYTHLDVYKRQ